MASSPGGGLPIGDAYQQATKYRRQGSGTPGRGDAQIVDGEHDLPVAVTEGGPGLWDVVGLRRSRRDFTGDPITQEQLAQLLWATQGITRRSRGHAFRASPSAGACYPIDTYLVVNHVAGLPAGLYHVDVRAATLRARREGDLREAIAAAALDQHMAAAASVVFCWTAIPARSKPRYHERAYRYIYLDAGHIGQNLHLAATAMGLGCCAIGAFLDDEVNAILGVDGQQETAVYLSAIGVPRA
ncbi:MAG: SagB/ThcOx family dehydrogenase [Candidatus Brocadiae bacterium]|nr:SagB/ThcOx family dehydrogenase [Candidatus Brocadiia bacterium]